MERENPNFGPLVAPLNSDGRHGPLHAADMTITPKTEATAITAVSNAIATHVFDWEGVKQR